jgi:putative serine/threonine protein kinase
MNEILVEEKATFSPSELTKKEHGAVLCYPGTDLSTFDKRIKQLHRIGVEELIFEGGSKVGRLGIIGRGCVSIVVKARLETEKEIVALKIRRADANRIDVKRDYELQRFANSFGVGPKAIGATEDLFAMQFIDGVRLGRWCQSLKTRTSKQYTQALIRDSLEQCFRLDSKGLDHGELSNPTKHILIRNGSAKPSTVIIDYESASASRRVSNVTAVAQFFLLGGWQSEKVRKILNRNRNSGISSRKIIDLLSSYKRTRDASNFEKFLSYIGVQTKH